MPLLMQVTLSQPPKNISFKDKLKWLQERRQVGIWVECCRSYCKKFRYISNVHDPLELPAVWYCNMNADAEANHCSKVEYKLNVSEEEDLIHALYSAGSLVWAQLEGFPWWPAMVDDCADTEQYYWLDGFSDIPNYYNVTFLDGGKVTRAWVAPNKLRPYFACGKVVQYQQQKVPVQFRRRINTAINQANDASKLPVLERLQKYSFIARYKGPINSPRKIHGLKRLASKYHDLSSRSSDSGSSSNEDSLQSAERAEIVKAHNAQTVVENGDEPPIANKRNKPTVVGKGDKLTVNKVNKRNVAITTTHSIDSQITIIPDSEDLFWKDKAVVALWKKSLSSVLNVSEEMPLQSQIVFKKSANQLISRDQENNQSLSSEVSLIHSQSCVDVTDVATSNITDLQDSEMAKTEESAESIFKHLFDSDAVVPSTETDVINLVLEESDMSDESDEMSQKSLNFDY